MEVEHDEQEIIQHVAALDIGKAELVCCVRLPGQGAGRRRMQEVRTFSTMTRSLLALSDWLTSLGVTRVVMEATSDSAKEATVPRARSARPPGLRAVAAGGGHGRPRRSGSATHRAP